MMDPPQKKRSLFGGFSFWGRSPSVTHGSGQTDDFRDSGRANALDNTRSASRNGPTASPESPAKRASAAQLSTRKIIDRPQGPSSKLSHSVSATDFLSFAGGSRRADSPTLTSTPKPSVSGTNGGFFGPRMPGDNPNKLNNTASFSSSSNRYTNFSGAATTPRTAFRSSAWNDRPGVHYASFSPRVPPNTIRESFPPATPGKTPRSSAAELNGGTLAHTSSASLFTMRIPSPPHDLTGERLAREVPRDHNRAGSIYADEFLTQYCPPDFDDLQRRQFFCILDLRRLKYAANEVFVKKDWKINILNFAKEYEKSRSLIMLHYGLYEFKTVKASEALKRQWQKEHGIAVSDDEKESTSASRTNGTQGILARGAGKRKAEEDLASDESAPGKPFTSVNKRRATEREPLAEATPLFSNKAKRKMDAVDSSDDSQPTKLQRAAPAAQQTSSVKSLFERIANGTSKEPSPAFSASTKQTATATTSQKKSLLDLGTKPSPQQNIFGHLSDTSKGNGNDDEASSSATSGGSEADVHADADPELASQEVGACSEPSVAPSRGTATPVFGAGSSTFIQKPKTDALSSTSSEVGDNAKGRSLFDRLTYGSDGQPVRVLDQGDKFNAAELAQKEPSGNLSKDHGTLPSNKTWNTDTPIKFASGASQPGSLFATSTSTSSQPSAPAVSFGAASTPKSSDSAPGSAEPSETSKPGVAAQDTSKSDAVESHPPESREKTASTPLFGTDQPTGTTSKLFGAPMPSFGPTKPVEERNESAAASTSGTSSLFGVAPQSSASQSTKPASPFQSSTLAGTPAQGEAPKQSSTQPPTLFGATTSKAPEASKPKSENTHALFSNGTSKSNSSPFGQTTPSSTTAPETKPSDKPIFGANAGQTSTTLFGANAGTTASEPKNLFAATPNPAPPATSNPLFGGSPMKEVESPKPQSELFGTNSTTAAPTPSGNIFSFGTSQSSAPAIQFGSGSSQPASTQQSNAPLFGGSANSSFTFTAGGSQQPSFNNPFKTDGGGSAPSSFNFSFGNASSTDSDGQKSTSTPFIFGGGQSNPAPTVSFGGASQPTASFGSTGGLSGPSFSFGATTPQPDSGSIFSQQKPSTGPGSIFASGLAPPAGGTSTGTNTPFTFGGASSLATTPATGTPEPGVEKEDGQGTQADGDDAPQEQISLTEGGPGEEDESVVHEVRAKALKLVIGSDKDSDKDLADASKDKKNPWKVQGVGPLRLLKHKTTGAVRILLRAEPRGHIALNKAILPNFTYKPEPVGGKYVKITTSDDKGTGLETWMLQVKTKELAQSLADALEKHKESNKKS
ncbi:hypothetical protein VTK73DRAFT_4401 [Phialemonium thermophilum]|uniref:RanBD1 domain-containing protein n=1 Tax=Phialemonium thermophilum TaxID=223376 RepID=A0ABR3WTJ1_9PEZI